MKTIVIHSAARAELDEAIAFYESCAHGLGIDLQLKVEEAVAKIQRRIFWHVLTTTQGRLSISQTNVHHHHDLDRIIQPIGNRIITDDNLDLPDS